MLLLTANPQLKVLTTPAQCCLQLHWRQIPLLTSPLPSTVHTHIYTPSPPPPLRCRDSFVTKMNLSSALQPKQVIWLPQPQIKLVWFNFRFGLLLQPYIKADVFHYTAKPQASRRWWPTPSIGRHHGSIMAFTRYRCRSSKASGSVCAIGGLVIHKATQPRTVQPTYLACLDSCRPSCDIVLAGLAAQKKTKKSHDASVEEGKLRQLNVTEKILPLIQQVW